MGLEIKKQFIVTTSWDDGLKLDLKIAKLLNKYNLKGTFYIAPNNREWNRKDILSNNEIKQLSHDFEIGVHTMTHPTLTQINEQAAYQEMLGSKIFLEKLINTEMKMFCYPKGFYNARIKSLVRKTGFIGARTVKRFHIFPPVDFFEFGTTVQATPHRLKFSPELPLKLNLTFSYSLFIKEWVNIAKKIFDYVYQNGGIFHLWGHSWEVDKHDDWEKLEDVFSYISQKPSVKYLENGELIEEITA